jgi:hypothetical protein
MVAKEEVEKLGTLGLIPIHDNDNAQIEFVFLLFYPSDHHHFDSINW